MPIAEGMSCLEGSELVADGSLGFKLRLVLLERRLFARGEIRALVIFTQAVGRAERRAAQVAVADDAHGSLRTPVGRVEVETTPLLRCSASETKRKSNRRPLLDSILCQVAPSDELSTAIHESLFLDRDGGSIGDRELEVGDIRGIKSERVAREVTDEEVHR